MNDKALTIECPNCGESFNLDEALRTDIEEQFEKRYKAKLNKEREELTKSKAELDKQKAGLNQMLEKQLAAAKADLEKKARAKAEKDLGVELDSVKAELEEKAKKLADSQKAELALLKKARDLEEREKNLALETEKRIAQERFKIEEAAGRRASEEAHLKLAEKDRKLAEALSQVDEMKRKMELGSQQSQGETLELMLEEVLRQKFPLDTIEPVPKGLKGADVLQTVLSNSGQVAGSIIWETKRTKAWSGDWVEKLKDDSREVKADVAILVSQVLPKDVDGFGYMDGVWVSDIKSYLGLALMIRMQLLQLQQVRGSMVNRGEKMEILYSYLTGTQFRQRVEAIVEGFTSMKDDLDREKRVLQKQWAAREQQIEKVLINTAGMYGDLQGLIGTNLPKIEVLELG